MSCFAGIFYRFSVPISLVHRRHLSSGRFSSFCDFLNVFHEHYHRIKAAFILIRVYGAKPRPLVLRKIWLSKGKRRSEKGITACTVQGDPSELLLYVFPYATVLTRYTTRRRHRGKAAPTGMGLQTAQGDVKKRRIVQ